MAKRKPRPSKASRYTAVPGSPITDAQAAIVGSELDAMERAGVRKTAKELLARARSRRSPLHGLFDWNDESAAEKHRVEWARRLIASVRVVDITTRAPVKAYYPVTIKPDDGPTRRQYERRSVVLESDDALAQVSRRLYGTIRAAADDADSLGFGASDSKWRAIIAVVRQNPPDIVLASDAA